MVELSKHFGKDFEQNQKRMCALILSKGHTSSFLRRDAKGFTLKLSRNVEGDVEKSQIVNINPDGKKNVSIYQNTAELSTLIRLTYRRKTSSPRRSVSSPIQTFIF